MPQNANGKKGGLINVRALDYYAPLQKVHIYLRNNPGASLTLAEAADIAGYERTHFSRFFHQKTGVRFKYWLDLLRIEQSLDRLRRRDDSITTIAYDCGFADLTTFERTFKRIIGLTPMEFRRSISAGRS